MVVPKLYPDLPSIKALQYGSVLIEGYVVPCCIGENSMVYIPVQGVCSVIKVPAEPEIERIIQYPALQKGLANLPFQVHIAGNDGPVNTLVCSISLTRLHAWLMMIPADALPEGETRDRLGVMQDRLADLIYAYLGRPLLPEEFREVHERSLPAETRQILEAMEKVPGLQDELNVTKASLEQVTGRVKTLEIAISLSVPDGSFIDEKQYGYYRKMIGIVGAAYEKKHPDEFWKVEAALKQEFDFVHYKVILVEQWEGVVKSLIATYRSLVPAGTPIPQIFKDALILKAKPPLRKIQPGLF